MKHYYFGCNKESGHCWYIFRDGRLDRIYRPEKSSVCGDDFIVDGGYTPKDTTKEGIANLWNINAGKEKWTILSFWDNSIDSRPGSHSTFLFEGEHGFDTTLALIQSYYTTVFKRYKFEITLKR